MVLNKKQDVEEDEFEDYEDEEEEEEKPLPPMPTPKKPIAKQPMQFERKQKKPIEEIEQEVEQPTQQQIIAIPRAVPIETMINEIYDILQEIRQTLAEKK